MRDVEIKPDGATVDLTLHELRILNNAMNEILNGFRIAEFETRVGGTQYSVEILLRQVQLALRVCRASAATD
jgi:hypothetical protein